MKGLYRKYHITKADGSPCDPKAEYFVLRLDTDPAARIAALAYAEAIKDNNPKFSEEIKAIVAWLLQ